jgi:hypothetical protein
MDEKVGSIKDIMIDVPTGRVAYAVLSVGGFLSIGERLFAIPWEALTLDEDRKCFIFDVDKRRLENAPGFDQDHWPDMADVSWGSSISSYWLVPDTSNRVADEAESEAVRPYDRRAANLSESQIEALEAEKALDSREGDPLLQAEQTDKSRSKAV